jgi:carbon-monoxide dehydrogenase medium subunit
MLEPLRLFQPSTVEEAVAVLAELGDDAKVVAGATALTLLYRQRLIAPGALVSIGRIPGLKTIEVAGGELRLGALVTHREVELSPVVRGAIPVVADVFGKVANVRVRNAATVGGVMAESDYASDPPAVLVALDAVVDIQGPDGRRSIPAGEFFVAFYETALAHDELVVGVRVPVPAAGTGAVYHKFVTRSSEDRPCVGVCGVVALGGDGTVRDLRVAVGAAAETPQRFRDAEQAAIGRALTDEVIAAIADAYADRVDTLDDMRGSAWYRTEMVRVWVRRAIESAAAAATPQG